METKNNHSHEISRRDFFKRLGIGAAVTGTALTGCDFMGHSPQTIQEEIPTGQMTFRTSSTTGDRVSILGYGMMRLPMITEKGKADRVDQETVNRLVDYAMAHGVNYFDTAPVYCQGLSEQATGIALSRYPRDKYFIATKMSNQHAAETGVKGKELYKLSVDMYRRSLINLKTDYIDYYLLHAVGGGNGMGLLNDRFFDSGILEFLLNERKAGRIRNLGFSYHGDIRVYDYLLSIHDQMKWDFVQIQLNYLDWTHAKMLNPYNTNADYLYGELQKRGIPAIIMEPLLGGRLSKLPEHIVTRLKQRDPENSVASWAFRFAGTHPGVLTVLSGMTYMEHLQDNVRTYSPLKPLTNEEMKFLEQTAELMMQYPTVPCNDCKYCMPCPYGIDIPAILLHYNKCVNEGNLISDPGDDHYRQARRAYLIGYDRSVPQLRQANHCIGCNQCSPACPQGIDIPKELHRIDTFVENLKRNK